MRVLDRHARPVVEFDPCNVEHRRHYAAFLSTGSWATCPVLFAADERFVSIPVQLNSIMTDYYIALDRKLRK